MFCYYLLGGDTAVSSGLYARLYHAFFVGLQTQWLRFFASLPVDRFTQFLNAAFVV